MSPTDDETEAAAAGGGGGSRITLGLNTDFQAAIRFPAWMALAVFSAVCIAAFESRREVLQDVSQGSKWVLAVCIMSFLFSFSAVLSYLCFRNLFVGQIAEIILVSLLTAFWAAGLPTIMNPKNNIAVTDPGSNDFGPTVTNANLYFFAWLSFCAVIYLSGSLAQETFGISIQQIATKAARWYGLTAASVVVMSAAVRTFKTTSCKAADESQTEYCKRTKLAISVGVVGFVLAAVMTFLVQRSVSLNVYAETVITTLQLLMWCFGVSYITFGKSPGSAIGNLYFSSWICFILAVFLFAVSFRECVAGCEGARTNNAGETHANDDNHT